MESHLHPQSAMSPETEPIHQQEQTGEHMAFIKLVDTLLSVSRVDLQKKMQREERPEAEKPA
ncbi:MAG: hypothetical protein QOJ99_2926 [Bryobacterales bacterium]|jgi:hypothetical protein|nr:hypothetical protein [Bryobacterales bacterium]